MKVTFLVNNLFFISDGWMIAGWIKIQMNSNTESSISFIDLYTKVIYFIFQQ